MRRFIGFMALIAAVLSISRIFLMSAMLSDDLKGLWNVQFLQMVLASKEGLALMWRLPCLLLLAVWANSGARKLHVAVPLLSAILIPVSFAMVGHVNEVEGAASMMAQLLIMLHLLSVSFWLGSLWPLLHIARQQHAEKGALIVHQFGKYAMFVVGILLFAGISVLWVLQGFSINAWQTEYGQLMMLKLIFVSLLLGLAAYNKYRLTPRLRHGEREAFAPLRRSIVMEMIIAGIILLFTASFTTLTGPSVEPAAMQRNDLVKTCQSVLPCFVVHAWIASLTKGREMCLSGLF
ncbi:CopD family protein [Undibacterium sp. SXout7W]|uniref:CopD family protein n=1 Tax=Undibacterium sp. SXout7W TaxID=3413049 RepID=UPI003BF01CCD